MTNILARKLEPQGWVKEAESGGCECDDKAREAKHQLSRVIKRPRKDATRESGKLRSRKYLRLDFSVPL